MHPGRLLIGLLALALLLSTAARGEDSQKGAGEASIARSEPVAKTIDTARFISFWEGYLPRCDDSLDGMATIGYGHVIRFSPCTAADRLEVWSRADALRQLRADIAGARTAVLEMVRVPTSLSVRAALTSFAFNVGAEALRTSTLLRELNAGRFRAAAEQFRLWVHGPGAERLPGLVRRREAERRLFLSGLPRLSGDF